MQLISPPSVLDNDVHRETQALNVRAVLLSEVDLEGVGCNWDVRQGLCCVQKPRVCGDPDFYDGAIPYTLLEQCRRIDSIFNGDRVVPRKKTNEV